MWQVLPLKSVATEQRESVNPATLGDQLVDHYSIPALDSAGKPEVVPAREIQSSKQRLKGGEVIVSRLNPRKARVHNVPALHERIALASGEFIVMRPRHIDPSFLKYCLLAESTRQYLDSRVQSVTRSHQRIRPEILMKLPISAPDLPQQQAIADYLDSETARIDILISKKRRMLELLDERSHALYDEWYERLSSLYGRVPIRRWSSDIEQGWSPICDSEPAEHHECGVIRTSAVSSGRFIGGNNKRLPAGIELNLRWLLRNSDLLVTRGSGTRSRVGRACVASVRGRILTLSDLVYRVKLVHADPEFVSAALQSSPARAQIEASIRTDAGLTLKIRRDDLADVRIPAVPMDRQVSETANLTKCLMLLQDSKLRVEKQIALLTERRQALITAVVAGETPTSREVA